MTAEALGIFGSVGCHCIVGGARCPQALYQSRYTARRDRTGYFVIRHAGAHPAQHAAHAHGDLAALFCDRNDVALRFALEAKAAPRVMQQHLLLSIQPQQDDRRLNGHIAQRSINYTCRFFAHHRDLCHRFRRDPSGLAQRGDVGILRDLLNGLETMRQAADATVAVVLRLSRENSLRALDPEDATRRNSSRSAIRRSWRSGSLNSVDPGRNVADKGNCNGRNREAEELLQIEVPPLEATVRHGLSSRSDLPLISSSTAQSPSPATEPQ